MFVGTKRQAHEAIERVGTYEIPFVSQRWLGGTLTNFHTIKKSIDKLNKLEDLLESEESEDLTKRERFALERKRNKLLKLFKGIKDLNGLPDALFVIDPKREKIAVQEARIMNIPVIAIVDTNCDPDAIDHVIPGNDDAIRAINLFVSKMVSAIQEGRAMVGADKPEAEGVEVDAATVEAEKPEVKAEEAPREEKAAKKTEAKAEEAPKKVTKTVKATKPAEKAAPEAEEKPKEEKATKAAKPAKEEKAKAETKPAKEEKPAKEAKPKAAAKPAKEEKAAKEEKPAKAPRPQPRRKRQKLRRLRKRPRKKHLLQNPLKLMRRRRTDHGRDHCSTGEGTPGKDRTVHGRMQEGTC